MILKITRLLLIMFILLGIVLALPNIAFAEGGGKNKKTKEIFLPPVANDNNDDKDEITNSLQARVKQKSPAYQVIGRELTKKELEAYGKNLSKEDIETQFLPRESKLVIIRAAITIGEAKNASLIVQKINFTDLKTYEYLVAYFTDLKEKYGSVLKGLVTEQELKLDEKQIFEETAATAYKTTFGIEAENLSEEEKQKLYSFLKGNDATTLTKMIEVLMKSMTEDDKKEILFDLLDEVGRSDLKKNIEFVSKIIKQDFTYQNLRELLQELKK